MKISRVICPRKQKSRNHKSQFARYSIIIKFQKKKKLTNLETSSGNILEKCSPQTSSGPGFLLRLGFDGGFVFTYHTCITDSCTNTITSEYI